MKFPLALIAACSASCLAQTTQCENKKIAMEKTETSLVRGLCPGRRSPQAKYAKDSEFCLGTVEWCTKGHYGDAFNSPRACLDSRQPLFMPRVTSDAYQDVCVGNAKFSGDTWRYSSEACLGTVLYCSYKHYEKAGESFANPQECLDSRWDPSTSCEANSTTGQPKNAGASCRVLATQASRQCYKDRKEGESCSGVGAKAFETCRERTFCVPPKDQWPTVSPVPIYQAPNKHIQELLDADKKRKQDECDAARDADNRECNRKSEENDNFPFLQCIMQASYKAFFCQYD